MSFTVAMKANIVCQTLQSSSAARIIKARLFVVTRISAFEEEILISDTGVLVDDPGLAPKTKRQIVGVLDPLDQKGLEVFRLSPVRPRRMDPSSPFTAVKGRVDLLGESKRLKLWAEFLVLYPNSLAPKYRMYLSGKYTPWDGEIS